MNNLALESLANSTSTMWLLINSTGDVLWYNSSAADCFGISGTQNFNLFKYLEPSEIEQITSSAENFCRTLKLNNIKDLGSIEQAASILNLSPLGEPNSYHLVVFRSSSKEELTAHEHEELISSIAHDLKNPLGAIFGFSDALLDTAAGAGLTENQRTVLRRIRSTAMRTLELVKNYQHLLEIGTIDTSSFKRFDLNSLVQAAVEHTWRESADNHIMSTTLAEQKLGTFADPQKVERVLTNILNNAYKFTPPGERIEVKTYRNGRQNVFEIRNFGSYIDPEEQTYIFEPYRRTKTGQGKSGAGLGLYICRRLVEDCLGTISLESSVEGGTAFKVNLVAV